MFCKRTVDFSTISPAMLARFETFHAILCIGSYVVMRL
jgi:hypothetical protein